LRSSFEDVRRVILLGDTQHAPTSSEIEANAGYPLRLLFEHLCVVANALERVVRHEVTTNTLDWALDALDHVIDRVAESLPPEEP